MRMSCVYPSNKPKPYFSCMHPLTKCTWNTFHVMMQPIECIGFSVHIHVYVVRVKAIIFGLIWLTIAYRVSVCHRKKSLPVVFLQYFFYFEYFREFPNLFINTRAFSNSRNKNQCNLKTFLREARQFIKKRMKQMVKNRNKNMMKIILHEFRL